jgi:large subunit ribosomal protein L17
MRHGVKLNHLGRTASHRHALLSGLACELIAHKRITTTLAKARALRVYVEPLITKSKTNTTHQRRVVFSYLNDKAAVKELFGTISEKIASRPGGYTRIIKLGTRLGDASEMALIELVDFNEVYTKDAAGGAKKKRTRRSGGGGRKKAADTTPAKQAAEAPADTEGESQDAPEEKAAEEAAPAAEKAEESQDDKAPKE